MIVATVFVYSIHLIQERKMIKYFIVILLSSLMHQSALILLLFYFIPQIDYFKNRYFTIFLVGLSLYFGNNNFWIEFLDQIAGLFQFIGYDGYSSEQLDTYIEEETTRNMGPRSLSVVFLTLILIWISPKLKEQFRETYFLAYYNLSIVGFLLYNLLRNTHHIFLRPVTYLTIFSVVSISYLLYYFKLNLNSKNIIIFAVVLFLAIAYLPMSIIADYGKGLEDYTNYKFFWYN
jgi:hypothetical protein